MKTFIVGQRIEMVPFETCPKKDRLQGTVIDLKGNRIRVLWDWQKAKGQPAHETWYLTNCIYPL